MFVIKDNIYEQLRVILEKGKITKDEPIFIELNEYLRMLGLEAVLSNYKVSDSKQPASISIFLKTSENFDSNSINGHDNNWSATYKYTQDIVVKWEQLLMKHGYSVNTADKTHVLIYDFEKICLVNLNYKIKEKIVEKVNERFPETKPKHIFCSSIPACRVVYGTERCFNECKSAGQFDIITKLFQKIFSKNDLFGYYLPEKISIYFHHCEEADINLYGLSRED